ncbi:unnamed protein product [Mytilus coruscus]|uniref:SGNH hydrolase-type esterase domain-containing protein n=1 Tax=Mytilus coruscus TaxID=42192 RepID=A0A6J8EQ28_MYTCO|nr:unnamed protein product [Mytilus coruscus]
MPRPPTFSTAMSTSGPIPYATNVGSVISPHSGATYATASPQSSTSADTNTVSSHMHLTLTDNNVPMQNAGNLVQTQDRDLLMHLWDMGHTPIRIKCLEACLVSYPDKVVAAEILFGFSHGFRLQYTGPRIHSFSKNLISAEQNSDAVLHKLQDEVNRGRMLGPFKVMPISTLRINPIGLVPKSDSSWRLITNLSFPPVCVCKTRYELSLFKAAFSLAFHGLFRVGELVVTNSLQSHTLQLSDIHILSGLLQVGIPSSKNDQLGKGSNIWIYPQSDLMICPVKLVSIVGDPVNVWIVGSSIVKHAFVTARDRPGGVNLGLGRLNASFWWQGKGGMVVKHVKGQLRTMKKYEDPPHFLVLHVAGNDIGSSKVGFLRNEIKNMIRWIMKEFPNSKLVWSQILTRLKWRHSNDRKAMDLCRYRINNSIAAFIISCGGYYIKHPDIHADQKFFQSDGVHLSSLGNELWLNILQGAMEHFIQKKDCASTFPC